MPVGPIRLPAPIPAPTGPLPTWLPPAVPGGPAAFPPVAVQVPTYNALTALEGLPYAPSEPPLTFNRPGPIPPRPPAPNPADLLSKQVGRVQSKREMSLAAREAMAKLQAARRPPPWRSDALRKTAISTSGVGSAGGSTPPIPKAIDGAPRVNPNAARGLRGGFGEIVDPLPRRTPLPSPGALSPTAPPAAGSPSIPFRTGVAFNPLPQGLRGAGQFGTRFGVPSAADGLRGGISRRMLGQRGALGGALAGAGAGLVSGGLRAGILDNFGGKTLTNEDAGGRLGRTVTGGMVAGVPFGAPGVAVGALGTGLGQAGVEALAAENDFMQYARGEQENALYDFFNKTSSAVNPLGWLSAGIHAAQGGDFDPFNTTRNILGGASKEFQGRSGDELSVPIALSRVPGIGGFLGGMTGGDEDLNPPGQTSVAGQIAKSSLNAAAGLRADQAQQAAVAANPATIADLARRMGMDEEGAAQLSADWGQQIDQWQVLMEQGLLSVPVADPADPKKIVNRQITEADFPQFLNAMFDQSVSEIPGIVAEANATRAAAEADAAAEQEALLRAFGYSVAFNDLMAPNVAAFQASPQLAPYAGLMQQSALNLPMLLARDEYRDRRQARDNEARQIAQQTAAAERAYLMEQAKLRARSQATADATDDATAILGG